ncbi:hypothetical protein BDV25DRAFT_138060 [Aspergillus avenaceus]|uniref:Mid2 domain-containing protein n=1 Tax=Aspergillus avenaceus TaxID=36643 RepID=A0A5N6U0X3_ASPAV|nr:hypothetical protein BDV25DRAFT_138060 [Aspergillus avenaceus]
MSTITPTATLDPKWTPSVYGCRQQGDFWIWDFRAQNDQRTVLGGPSQTTNCFPSTWNPTSAYAATECPAGFTSACQSSGAEVSTTICCPTVYSFSCVETSKNPHGPWFPCMSQYATSMKRTITRTDFAANTITFGEVTQRPNLHLFAMAMVIASPTATVTSGLEATSTSPVSSNTSPPSPGSSSISAGAAAGIGVGSAAGVVLIALSAWFLLLRRRKPAGFSAPPEAQATSAVQNTKLIQGSLPPQELTGEHARELPG